MAVPFTLLALGAASSLLHAIELAKSAHGERLAIELDAAAKALDAELALRLDDTFAATEPNAARTLMASAGDRLLSPATQPRALAPPRTDNGGFAPPQTAARLPPAERARALADLLARDDLGPDTRDRLALQLGSLSLRAGDTGAAIAALAPLVGLAATGVDEGGVPLAVYARATLAEAHALQGDAFRAARELAQLELDLAAERFALDPAVADFHAARTATAIDTLVAQERVAGEDLLYITERRAQAAALRWQIGWARRATPITSRAGSEWRGAPWTLDPPPPPAVAADLPTRAGAPCWLFARRTAAGDVAALLVSDEALARWSAPMLERLGHRDRARYAIVPELAGSVAAGATEPLIHARRALAPTLASRDLAIEAWGLEADRAAARQRAQFHGALLALALATLAAGLFTGYRFLARELEAARSQQLFIASVSHELRTPLTSIRLFAESLADQTVPPDRAIVYAQKIDREAQRLTRLIAGALDLAALDRKEVELASEPTDVAAVLDEARALFEHKALEHGCTVRIAATSAAICVAGDAGALVQVLLALLDNAAKYGRAGGTIELAAARVDDREGVIRVDDDGPGVPPAERERVLERFHRGPGTDGVPGLGLGLAIAATLVRAMGGRLAIETSPSGGARAAVTLRLARGRPALPAPVGGR